MKWSQKKEIDNNLFLGSYNLSEIINDNLPYQSQVISKELEGIDSVKLLGLLAWATIKNNSTPKFRINQVFRNNPKKYSNIEFNINYPGCITITIILKTVYYTINLIYYDSKIPMFK